ncbi:hypothetical protein ATHL_01010 [Anaerolinea thermolimosa]|uniref:hypothetical protein n=1 Tax=Anaerolinea thermolimosa TaxID=229919 RepID=UPI0007843CFA|nr:hypothetical protein [Anaerolinea thermolimosa]GAP06164.1 hypothetical protein ATHL_01010 [Anaerolinea thermolimosa]
MNLDILLRPFLWVLNGLLATLYLLAEHWALVAVLPLLGCLLANTHPSPDPEGQARVMRPALLVAAGLALAAVVFAPKPVPFLMAGLLGVGVLAVRLDAYRPDETLWSLIQSVILYALVGLGARVLTLLLENDGGLINGGVNYLAVLVSFALWLMPLTQAGMLIKNLLVHAPVGADPYTVIRRARERR